METNMKASVPRFSGLSITTGTVRYSDLSYLTAMHHEAMNEGYIDSILSCLDRGALARQGSAMACLFRNGLQVPPADVTWCSADGSV